MEWKIVYLILSIITLIFGIWNLALKKNPYLSIIGICWFAIILFRFFIYELYKYQIIKGLPGAGQLIEYIGLPAFIIIAFITSRYRK